MCNRKLSRALWGMVMFLFLTGPPAFAADKKPNIVIIWGDDILIRLTFALFFFTQGDGFTVMGIYDGLSGLALLALYLPVARAAKSL